MSNNIWVEENVPKEAVADPSIYLEAILAEFQAKQDNQGEINYNSVLATLANTRKNTDPTGLRLLLDTDIALITYYTNKLININAIDNIDSSGFTRILSSALKFDLGGPNNSIIASSQGETFPNQKLHQKEKDRIFNKRLMTLSWILLGIRLPSDIKSFNEFISGLSYYDTTELYNLTNEDGSTGITENAEQPKAQGFLAKIKELYEARLITDPLNPKRKLYDKLVLLGTEYYDEDSEDDSRNQEITDRVTALKGDIENAISPSKQ